MPTPKVHRMTEGAVERQRFLAAYKGFRFVRHPPSGLWRTLQCASGRNRPTKAVIDGGFVQMSTGGRSKPNATRQV